ncbi:MAG TPA: phosphoribosyltransferase family protein [Candidatus Saccharimonadales bacterium]|nr:phosphoribosyltransferase family protein [Candidatus Saccharimonadales bacterium]
MFRDRRDAGEKLASKMAWSEANSLVLAMPRGGVAVAFPIAQTLKTTMEVIIARKIGSPLDPELGIGAVAEDNVTFLNSDLVDELNISDCIVKFLREKEKEELEKRRQSYRNGKSLPLMTNKTVFLVDDGIATGVTAHAALLSLRKHHPKKIIFVTPICSSQTAVGIRPFVDKIICLESLEDGSSISNYYEDFSQMTDEEVLSLLHKGQEKKIPSTISESDFAQQIVW